MPEQNLSLAQRVELFSRATSEALNKAISEVLDAKGPWQLLYRLSRIVLLGLVLYTAWLLITLQPDLAKRMSTSSPQTLQMQVTSHQSQVQTLLAADGRSSQLGLLPGEQPLLGVEMAEALGNVAMGLCASEPPEALPITSQPSSAGGGVALALPGGLQQPAFRQWSAAWHLRAERICPQCQRNRHAFASSAAAAGAAAVDRPPPRRGAQWRLMATAKDS